MTSIRRWSAAEVKALRDASRLSKTDFAGKLGVTMRSVSNWEGGGPIAPFSQSLLDQYLDTATAEVVARFRALLVGAGGSSETPAPPATTGQPAGAGSHQPVGGCANDVDATFMNAFRVADSQHGGTRSSAPVTAGLMTEVGTLLAGTTREASRTAANLSSEEALIMATADESARHGRRAGSSNVGDAQLDQLQSALSHLSIDLLTEPLAPLLLELRQIRDEAFGALEGRQYPRQSRRLYAIGACACGLLAGTAADRFGMYQAALAHIRAASDAADLAEDPALIAWTASVRSSITFWQGRYRTAATIAQQARTRAPMGVEKARLAGLEARAWAKLFDRAAMTSALEAATIAREQDGPAAGEGVIAYPLSNQIRIAGTAYLCSGEYTKARAYLAEAVALLTDEYDSPAHLAAARTDLALAHLHAEALDDAARALRPLLAVTNTHRHLTGAVRRAEGLIGALTTPRYQTSGMARQLVREIEAFVADHKSNGEAVRAGVTSHRPLPQ